MWDLAEDIKNTAYKIKPYKRWNADKSIYDIYWRVKFGGTKTVGFKTREDAVKFIKEDWNKKGDG